MPTTGLILVVAALAAIAVQWARTCRLGSFGAVGWIGLGVFGGCAAVLAWPASEPSFVAALVWTGYILAVDSGVSAIRGVSLLRSSPEAFVWLAVLSILLWIPFEWYNLRLAAWYRSGLPPGLFRYFVLGWSFACIWPALFETADLLLALADRPNTPSEPAARPAPALTVACGAAGAAFVLVPLFVPRLDLGEYLFPLAGAGFLLLFDPLNARRDRASLWLDRVSRAGRSRICALAAAAVLCGLLADCLNYFAKAQWHSLWRFAGDLKLFELPLAAYLALPVFGLQAYALHVFATGALHLPAASIPSVRAPVAVGESSARPA